MRTSNKLNTKRTKTLQQKATKKVHNIKKRTSTTQQKRSITNFQNKNKPSSNNICSINNTNNLVLSHTNKQSHNNNNNATCNITSIYAMNIPLLTTAQRYLHHRKTQQHIAQLKHPNLPNTAPSTFQTLSQNILQLNRSTPFHKRSISRHFSTTTTTTTTTDDNNNNNHNTQIQDETNNNPSSTDNTNNTQEAPLKRIISDDLKFEIDIKNTTSDNTTDDVISASIPKPRHTTDESQYRLAGGSVWKKPVDEYAGMSENQKQEIKERFNLENSQRMQRALTRLRSTQGTMAYGQPMGVDASDGAMPQRNGSMSRGVLDAFERAEEYKRRNAERIKQKQNEKYKAEIEQKRLQDKKDFEFKPFNGRELQDDQTHLGEFSSMADKMFKRTLTQEEQDKVKAEQLLGQNWMAKWF